MRTLITHIPHLAVCVRTTSSHIPTLGVRIYFYSITNIQIIINLIFHSSFYFLEKKKEWILSATDRFHSFLYDILFGGLLIRQYKHRNRTSSLDQPGKLSVEKELARVKQTKKRVLQKTCNTLNYIWMQCIQI